MQGIDPEKQARESAARNALNYDTSWWERHGRSCALQRMAFAHDSRREASKHAARGNYEGAGRAYRWAHNWYDLAHELSTE